MNIDLAAVLVILVFVSGVIWLYDILRLAPYRRQVLASLPENITEKERQDIGRMPVVVDFARSLFPVFVIVLVLRSFLVEPFRIPSGSMMPTLLVGDFILVNKYQYGIRLPVLNSKIIPLGEPARGDVVVFRYPLDPSTPYIKRVVGLPGDHIMYHPQNKTLYVNSEPVPQEMLGIYQGVGQGSSMTGAEQRTEHLPPDREHNILVAPERYNNAPHLDMLIPQGQYFVLGDNRDNSRDSRYWGTVPEENLIGRAFLIWMNWDLSNGGIDWKRLGSKIL